MNLHPFVNGNHAKIDKKQSNQMINDNQKSQMIRHFMAQVKTEDLLNVAFMKPVEVCLRTSKTDKSVPVDSLPEGLMLVVKQNGINDNKYKLERFRSIPEDITSFETLRANHMDNYISLLKKNEDQGIQEEAIVDEIRISQTDSARSSRQYRKQSRHKGFQFGICVSMCKQDKKVLKKTLIGVAQNIDQMIRSGVCPDDIFVVVMIDGVQSVDKSIYEYFEEFERESEVFIEEDDTLTLKKKYENYQYHQQIEKQQPLNFTKFLFKPDQFANRIESKFQHVREKYDEVLRIKKSIQNIKKQNNKDNDNLKMILNKMIDRQKDILKKIKSQKKVAISQQSIMKELASSEEECNQYVSTRDSLAYVSAYRLRTSSLCSDLKDSQTKLTLQRSTMIEGQFQTQRMYDQQLMDHKQQQQSLQENRLMKRTIKYVNLFFCIKYKETGKLSSHNWFFNGFCQELKPKYTAIVDVGVRPYPDALFKMYRCMKLNDRVGSVCGYMRLIQQKVEDEQMTKSEDMDCLSSIFVSIFDIQRAQQIENHFEHLVDKPFESIFKFVHVLPGAFSAYNMDALRPTGQKDELLREYFQSMDEKLASNKVVPSTFTAKNIITRVMFPQTIWKCCNSIDPDSQQQVLYNQNVNLAEDRILCLGIHKNDKDIVFMPDVYAQVQPIKMINQLMGHKKREINGGHYSFQKVRHQFSDSQNKGSSFFIRFQLLYLTFMKFLSYFAPALIIFIIEFAFQIIRDQFLADLFSKQSATGIGSVLYATITNIIVFVYALMLLAVFFYSLHLDYKSKKFIYMAYLITTILGILSMISFIVFLSQTILGIVGTGDYLRRSYIAAIQKVIKGYGLLFVNILRFSLAGAVFLIIFPVFIYSVFFRKFGIMWDLFVGFLSYVFYFPTYAAVLPIYSRCRLDDISSATKGNLGSRNQKLKQTWKILKLMDVSKYFIWNSFAAVTLLVLHSYILIKFFALLFLLMIFSILQLIKVIPVLFYTISYKCKMMNNPLKPTQQQIEQNSHNNVFRVFNTIKRLEEDLRVQIQYSFNLAAEDQQYQQSQKTEIKKMKQQEKKIGEKPKKRIQSTQFHLSRQSIKIMQNFQGNKFANIRQSSALKGSFYPFQFGAKRQQIGTGPIVEAAPPAPLQMVLLKQQIGQQALGNTDMKVGQQKLKQFQIFRGTIARPIVK